MCCTSVCAWCVAACGSHFPVGRNRSHACCSLDHLCSLAFPLLCPLCSYTIAAEKVELCSLQSLWKFISSKEYWKTSVEFALHLLNLGSGTIKGIRWREMVLCFQWKQYDGRGSKHTADIQSWQSEMWAVENAHPKFSQEKKEVEKMSKWQTQAILLEDRWCWPVGWGHEVCRKHKVQWCAGEGPGCCQDPILFMVSFQGYVWHRDKSWREMGHEKQQEVEILSEMPGLKGRLYT